MSDFMEKAKDMANQHDDKVDQGLERGGDMADERTGGQYTEQVDKGVDIAQERTASGDQVPDQP
jgi:antitoxin protein of toxin-antitoxin system